MSEHLNQQSALEVVLEFCQPLEPVSVPVAEATGLILAESKTTRQTRGLWAGQVASAMAVARLARLGHPEVLAIPPPRLAVIAAGAPADRCGLAGSQDPRDNATAYLLKSLAQSKGVHQTELLQASDSAEDLAFVLDHVTGADLVLITGGFSGKSTDMLPRALNHYATDLHFVANARDLGVPICFATHGRQLVIGLAPSIMDCYRGFNHFVVPTLKQMMGHSSQPTPFHRAMAAQLTA